ncbi:hypothetical protein COHA_003068 [Chlorella ohadii]|uniref:Uncharacterized protein n=1 Tax=Chlorella ohadii TaxID=2649997 RepID=A0AAD5DVK6_9CHLO|nr:hypothetical protein COHA_003068 [Chlorella ohadii]
MLGRPDWRTAAAAAVAAAAPLRGTAPGPLPSTAVLGWKFDPLKRYKDNLADFKAKDGKFALVAGNYICIFGDLSSAPGLLSKMLMPRARTDAIGAATFYERMEGLNEKYDMADNAARLGIVALSAVAARISSNLVEQVGQLFDGKVRHCACTSTELDDQGVRASQAVAACLHQPKHIALDGLVPGGPLFESWLISFAAILMALHPTLVSMNDELGYFRCPNASTSVAALAPAVRQRRTQLEDAFLRAKQVVALQQALGAAVDTPTACLLEAASCSVPELLRGEVLTTPGNLLRRMVVRCRNGAEAGELRLLVEQAASQAAAAAAADAAGGADAKQDAALAVVKHKAAGAALEAKLQVAAADASRPSRLAAVAAGNLEQVQRELARQMRLAEQAMAVAAEAQAEAAVCRQEQAKLAERQAAFEKEVRERMAAAQQAAASAELKAEAALQAAASAELKAEAALQAAAAAELKAEAALQAAVAAQLKVEAALQAAGVAEVNTAAAAQEAVAQVRRDARAAHEELVRTVKGLELQARALPTPQQQKRLFVDALKYGRVGQAAPIASRVDQGLGLDEPGYQQVLEAAGHAAALQQLNAGAGAAAPRVVVLAGGAAATAPSLIEQHLIAAGRQGVIVVLPEAHQEQKKRRTSSLPDEVRNDGNSFAGRVNFLPSAAPLPLVGKRTTSWRRLRDGQQTHTVAAHEVRRVVPHPALAAAVPVSAVDVAADGSTTVQTAAPHPFSGAKQLASIAGQGAGALAGHHPVTASDRRKSQTQFRIKLPKQEAAAVQSMQQAAAAGGVSVSELHILDDSLTLYHFMVAPEGAAAAAAAAAAAGGEAAAAAAGEAVAAAPGPVADLLLPQLAQGPAAAGPPLQPVSNLFPAMPLFDQDVFGGGLGGIPMEADAAAGMDPALAGQLPWELGEPPLAAGGQPAQQQQQRQQQQQQQQPEAGAGGLGPQGPPGGGREAGPAAGHAQSEGHFRMLTVGGEQPVAGGPQFPGKALVVQGRAAITGPLEVQGVEVVSDERAKEDIREFGLDQGRRLADVAADITCFVYNYKGEDVRRLGLVAQQVQQALERHGAGQLGIVRRNEQGQLSLDITALQALSLAAVKDLAGDVQGLRQECAVMSLSLAGALQQAAAAAQTAATAAGGGGGAGSAGAAAPHTLSSSLSQGSLQAASSVSSLAQLLDAGDVDMDSSSSAEDGEAAAEGDAGGMGPAAAEDAGEFAGLSDEAVAQWLQQRLEPSNPHMVKKFQKLAAQLPRAALWQVYQETISQPTELTAQGDRARTLGGQFVKAVGRRASEESVRRKAGTAPPPPEALRRYQQQPVEALMAGRNVIHVAPTGSGKTAVAVAATLCMLQQDHSARIVFLAPSVALAEQQAGVFLAVPAFKDGMFRVACRAGDNSLPPRDWHKTLEDNHVLVLTTQCFLNALNAGEAHCDQLALLVLDECHHAQADHPTACILRAWHKSSQRAQLLGLTASPAGKASLHATFEALAKLQANLAAQWVVVDESDPELQAVLPAVAQEDIVVELAQQDAACAACLGNFVLQAVEHLRPLLPGFEAAVRHLSQEYFAIAAKVASSAAAQDGGQQQQPVAAALLAQLAAAVDQADVLPFAFSAEGGTLGRHPKFRALAEFLRHYGAQQSFHGILFARTREAVRSLTQLLRTVPELEGVQAVMADFRQPGRRLLVSTSAAEEGIDVPRCEFVVRYAATQTGRERVQSAGRARKFGSRFVEIIEATHEELSLIRKSRAEEANMKAAVRALGALGLAG